MDLLPLTNLEMIGTRKGFGGLAPSLWAMTALVLAAHPAAANSPARAAGYRYLSPVPGASYVSPQTRFILIRFENLAPAAVTNLAAGFITVTGATSGLHPGMTRVASDGRTVIFEMSNDFVTNELVTVSLNPLPARSGIDAYECQFMITAAMPSPPLFVSRIPRHPVAASVRLPDSLSPGLSPSSSVPSAQATALAMPEIKPNGVSVPSDFPIAVITPSSNASPGYIFVSNDGQGSIPYAMFLDNNGLPVWYRRGAALYFRPQGNGLITLVGDVWATPAYDQDFNYVRSYRTVNGYALDNHELDVFADGSYLMLGYRENTVDMSRYVAGGVTNATVVETVIQGFTAQDELIFQWRSWDHYDVRDIPFGINLMSSFHFAHMNALDLDTDGQILVSSRELSEVTKIDRDTGDIIWRLSGPRSTFTFTNDPFSGFSFQHDINALGNGRYMVFDNGNSHNPAVSRAVEYELDPTQGIATLVWQFRDTPDKYTWVKGNAQRLPTGNTLINFVQPGFPAAIEADSNRVKQFELSLFPENEHYRVYRYAWNGVVAVPYLVLEPDSTGLNLVFNKFGDTNVLYYRIYGDTAPHPTSLFATSDTTLKRLTSLENGRRYYFRVTAVNREGVESGFSNEENVDINIIKPGMPMIVNGDFDEGTNAWTCSLSGTAAANWRITNGMSFFEILSSGGTPAAIQLRQAGLALMAGKKYVFEFDGWAQAPRYIEAKVGQAAAPYLNYSGTAVPFLTPVTTHYRYVFTMQQASDFNASLMFNLGGSVLDLYLDNISLFNAAPGDLNLDRRVTLEDLKTFTADWLKPQTGLAGDLNGDAKVDFRDFSIFAADWTAD